MWVLGLEPMLKLFLGQHPALLPGEGFYVSPQVRKKPPSTIVGADGFLLCVCDLGL